MFVYVCVHTCKCVSMHAYVHVDVFFVVVGFFLGGVRACVCAYM